MDFNTDSKVVTPTTTSQVGALSVGPSRFTYTPLGVVSSPSWVPFASASNYDQMAVSWARNGTSTSVGAGQSGVSYNFGAAPPEPPILRTPEYFTMPKTRRTGDLSNGEIAATEVSLGLSAPDFRTQQVPSIVASSGLTVPVLSMATTTLTTSSGGLNPETPRYNATNGGNVGRHYRYRRLNVTEGEGTVTKPKARYAPYHSLVRLSDIPDAPIQPFVKLPDNFVKPSPTTPINEEVTSLSERANSHMGNMSGDQSESFSNNSQDSLSREIDKINFQSKFASELQQSHSKVPSNTSVNSALNSLSKDPKSLLAPSQKFPSVEVALNSLSKDPQSLFAPSQKFPSVEVMRGLAGCQTDTSLRLPKVNVSDNFFLDNSTDVRNFLSNGVATRDAINSANMCSTPNRLFKTESSDPFPESSQFGKRPLSRKIAASIPNFHSENRQMTEKKEDEKYGTVLKPVLEDILEQQKLISTYLNASDNKKFGFPPAQPVKSDSNVIPPIDFSKVKFTSSVKQETHSDRPAAQPTPQVDFSKFKFTSTLKPEVQTSDVPAAKPTHTGSSHATANLSGPQWQPPANSIANLTQQQLQQFMSQEFEKLMVSRSTAGVSDPKDPERNTDETASTTTSIPNNATATKKSVRFDVDATAANTPAPSEQSNADIMQMMQVSFKTALQQMIDAGCIVRPGQAPHVEPPPAVPPFGNRQDAAVGANQSTGPASSNASTNIALNYSPMDPNSIANSNRDFYSSANANSHNPSAFGHQSGNASYRDESWQRDCGMITDPVERQLLDRSGVYTGGLPHLKHINTTANHTLGLDSIPQSQFLVQLDASSVSDFSGKIEDYEDFRAGFLAYAQAIPQNRRLHILRTKLDKNSKSLISGCLSKNADAFEQAIAILDSFCGNEDQLVQILISKIQQSFDYRAKDDHYRFKVMVSKIRECYSRVYKIDPYKCSYLNGNINSLYACVPKPVEKRMTLEIFMNKKVTPTFGKALDLCEDQVRYEDSRVVSLRAAHNLRTRSSSSDKRSSTPSSDKHKQNNFFNKQESSYCAESDTDSNTESVITAAEHQGFTNNSKKNTDRGRSKSRDRASSTFREKSKSATRSVEKCNFCKATDHNTLFCEKEVPDIAKLVSSLRLCWLCFSNQHFSSACLANETRAKMLEPFKCTDTSCKPEPHNLRLCQK